MNHKKRIEPGQESVWDYPRPPRLEESHKYIKVIFNGVVIAETERAKRILETSHPPAYYIPPEDMKLEHTSLRRLVRHFVNGKVRLLTIPSPLVTKWQPMLRDFINIQRTLMKRWPIMLLFIQERWMPSSMMNKFRHRKVTSIVDG